MRQRGVSGHRRFFVLGRTEEQREGDLSDNCSTARDQKQSFEINVPIRQQECLSDQLWSRHVRPQRPQPENHQVEQSLSARPRIFREKLIDEEEEPATPAQTGRKRAKPPC